MIARIANPTGMRINQLLLEAEEVLATTDVRNLAETTRQVVLFIFHDHGEPPHQSNQHLRPFALRLNSFSLIPVVPHTHLNRNVWNHAPKSERSMPTNDLQPIPMDRLAAGIDPETTHWLWHGFLHPGDITLLTSQWKTGKTTLLSGLLQHLGTGTPFLDFATRAAKAWVVSEESASHWAERLQLTPIGAHVQLLARPFRSRPTIDEWQHLINRACEARAANVLDLFVVDPLASFLPGRCESDAATLIEVLQPLHQLTDRGVAILLLHHPRKNAPEVGNLARGSGALLGFVDISLELTRYSHWKADANCRLIRAQSRRRGTPERVAYEWNPTTGTFNTTIDPKHRLFEENWARLRAVLEGPQRWNHTQGNPRLLANGCGPPRPQHAVRMAGPGLREEAHSP